jgi:hypothetical protein
MSAYYTDDYDGDARPQDGTWEIGADEVSGSYVPEGACCVSGGSCSVTTLSLCENPDIWMGAGTTCDPNPCVPPEGDPVSGLAEGVSLSGVRKD